jgi:hypothetical protein
MARLVSVGFIAAVALSGCATEKMSGDQLARVAKDWSLSIRASQVIPVYPLTEDLQPGDVFLVQTPIDEQVKVYLDKGFLPLENLVTRLPLTGYAEFYPGWPKIGDGADAPPRPWQFPTPEAADADFSHAPLAAFPTYNFSVSRGGGLSVAIPVQSVPVGLNLLDSASANGTITLKDAYTYGLPVRRTYDAIHTWSRDNVDYLKQFEPTIPTQEGKVVTKAQVFYLRVINRVYLVKSVDVSLFSNRAASAAGSAGVPQPVQLLNIANANTDAAKQFEAINQILASAGSPAPAGSANAGAAGDASAMPPPVAVGGSVKLAMATSRSVSFVETFRRPLAIGYLASDYAILKGGVLATPTPTFSILEGRPVMSGQAVPYQGCDADCLRIRPWLKQAGNQAKLESWLETKGGSVSIADLLTGNHADLRRNVVNELIEGSN